MTVAITASKLSLDRKFNITLVRVGNCPCLSVSERYIMSTKSIWTQENLGFFDDKYNPGFQAGLWAKCPLSAIRQDSSIGKIFEDDFHSQTSTKAAQTGVWVIVEDDGASGTDGIQETRGGWYKQFCDGDDNDESYMATKGSHWQMKSGKPLWIEFEVNWTNSATTAGAFIVGLMEGGGDANTLADTEGGPPSDYDGLCWFKQSGETAVSFETSIATAQVTNAAFHTFVSGTAMVLGAYWDGVGTVTPYINGVAGTPHAMAATGALAKACFGCKSNGAEEYFLAGGITIVDLT